MVRVPGLRNVDWPLWVPSRAAPVAALITESVAATPRGFESVRELCVQRLKQAKLADLERIVLGEPR